MNAIETENLIQNPPQKHTRGGNWYKHSGGRPKVVTDIVRDRLKEAFLLGCKDVEAALFAGISYSAFKQYQLDHPDFVEEKNQWKENPTLQARKKVVEALKTDTKDAQWFLERTNPEFKEKQEISVAPQLILEDYPRITETQPKLLE
jgi:hypothetical protein